MEREDEKVRKQKGERAERKREGGGHTWASERHDERGARRRRLRERGKGGARKTEPHLGERGVGREVRIEKWVEQTKQRENTEEM